MEGLTREAQVELLKMRLAQLAAEKSRVPQHSDPVAWIQKNFIIPELKGPLVLQPYQIKCMREALARDKEGRFKYSTVVWSDIKKSIKSTIAAAVALWRGFSLEWGQIILVANDLQQANSRVGFYMRRAIELNPQMKAVCQIRNYRTSLPNHTSIESVPIDPSGEAGSNADFIVFSELWGAHQEAQQRMWTEMTLPPAKFGFSQRWVETYAGYSGESPLLEQLYELGVKQGEVIDLGMPGLEAYANPSARLFVLWNTRPRCPWQSDAYYAQEASILPANEFLRVHRNEWVSSTEAFIPMEWWDACKTEDMPPLLPHESCIFALDAGVSSDCFAIVGVSRRENKIYLRYAKAFVPKPGQLLNFGEVEAEIRRIRDKFPVVEWAYDAYQLHDMATRLGREGFGWFRPFPQTSPRLIADKGLQDLIREQRVVHTGDPVVRDHLGNANAKTEGDKLRLVKRSELLKIDLAVALSMAAAEAIRLNVG